MHSASQSISSFMAIKGSTSQSYGEIIVESLDQQIEWPIIMWCDWDGCMPCVSIIPWPFDQKDPLYGKENTYEFNKDAQH